MNAVFFGLKRVHLRVLHFTRHWLREIELTPARFDMMRIVELYKWGVAQQEIQRRLGVSAATVSRMLKALEELGFVVREEMDHDRRRRRVHLTRLGLETLRDAMATLIDSGFADRLAEYGFHYRPCAARPRVERLQKCLRHMRKRYFDVSPCAHPWTPPEIVPIVPNLIPVFIDGEVVELRLATA